MNYVNKKIIFASLILIAIPTIFAAKYYKKEKSQHQKIGQNPYTWSPRYFNAENGVTGRYWAGNGTKKYPGKAFIEDVEYQNIVVIEKSKLDTPKNKKLRKHKDYLGFYIDPTNNREYCLYGVKKNPDPVDNGPDADVLTQIAIDLDYGIGE